VTRIALFQSNTGIDPQANARALVEAIEQAAQGGAEMLFTPEMSGLLDRESARAASNVRSEEEDEVLAAVQDAAKRNSIWVDLGSLAVLLDNGKVANRGFVIDREAGSARATTRCICSTSISPPAKAGGSRRPIRRGRAPCW
jgi:predicted amidohydrolase